MSVASKLAQLYLLIHWNVCMKCTYAQVFNATFATSIRENISYIYFIQAQSTISVFVNDTTADRVIQHEDTTHFVHCDFHRIAAGNSWLIERVCIDV